MSRLYRFASLVAVLAAMSATFTMTGVTRAEQPMPLAMTHRHWDFYNGPLTNNGDGSPSSSQYKNPPSPVCANGVSLAANVNTDCEGPAPHNETAIAVDPNNGMHMISDNNDYQIAASNGGPSNETALTRAHVTFDGGKSWTTYPIQYSGYTATGDPGIAFDADGTAYISTLGFGWSQGGPTGKNPDVLVSHSTDGGKTWSTPSKVATGSGSFFSVGTSLDKEAIAAWGHGNAIVTYTVFSQGQKGSYISSPIYASVTHDGGRTWSAGTAISGSASFCLGAQGGTSCNQSQGSVPAVAADGSIYVSFFNTASNTTGRDQILVVKVDPTTGQRIAGPYRVGDVFDGITDFPISAFGDTTYQDSQFRTWSFGDITTDPTNSQHLAMIWSDMRNSTLPANPDPYQATTNSDIIVSQSTNGGQTWSAPSALKASGDQFMPWGAYDTAGKLRIGYFDRSYDPNNHEYGYTLATETVHDSLNFSKSQLTTTLSDPTQGDRWFSSFTPNPDFPNPTTFLGDYSGIAPTPGGGVVGLWTDMRNSVTLGTRTGAGEDAFFATSS